MLITYQWERPIFYDNRVFVREAVTIAKNIVRTNSKEVLASFVCQHDRETISTYTFANYDYQQYYLHITAYRTQSYTLNTHDTTDICAKRR